MSAPGDPRDGGLNPPPGGYGQSTAQFGSGYGQSTGYGAPPAAPRNGFGIAALVLGLLALVLSWTVIGGIVFGVLALIFGLLGRARAKRGESTNGGLSLAGVVLGVIGTLIAVGLIAWGVYLLNAPAGQSYRQCVQRSGGDPVKIQQCVSDFGRVVGGRPPTTPTVTSQPAPASTPDHNVVYRADLHISTVTCVLPTMGTTNRQLEAWVQESVTCLDNAWQPVLATAGLPFSRPGVRRFSGVAPDRACTGDVATAYYCPADKVISVSPDGELDPIPDAHRVGRLLMTMAHEYGHHVQELSGITEAGDRMQRDYPYRGPVWLQLSRRMELQANCFAGVAIAAMSGRGSVGAVELADAASSIGGDDVEPGLPRDHGTAANNLKWFQTGLDAGRPAVCNTWLAAAGRVA